MTLVGVSLRSSDVILTLGLAYRLVLLWRSWRGRVDDSVDYIRWVAEMLDLKVWSNGLKYKKKSRVIRHLYTCCDK